MNKTLRDLVKIAETIENGMLSCEEYKEKAHDMAELVLDLEEENSPISREFIGAIVWCGDILGSGGYLDIVPGAFRNTSETSLQRFLQEQFPTNHCCLETTDDGLPWYRLRVTVEELTEEERKKAWQR